MSPAASAAADGPAASLLAGLGPFFAARVHAGAGAAPRVDAEPRADEHLRAGVDAGAGAGVRARAAADADGGPGPWRSMAELTDDSGVLDARVAAVRQALAAGGGQRPEAVELRVAASVAHLGLVARIISPYLALAALEGWVPERLALADLRWQPALGGPYPLSLPAPVLPERTGAAPDRDTGRGIDKSPAPDDGHGPDGGRVLDGGRPFDRGRVSEGGRPSGGGRALDGLADAFADAVCGGAVAEIGAACARFGLSPHVRWGNAASALNGAAGMIASARPASAARARALAGLVLERAPLRGSAGRTSDGRFRRRSCCLIYRAAPGRSGALCGDCALSHAPGRRA